MSEVLRKNDERTSNIDVLEMDDESISADAISDDEQAEMLKIINDVETRVIQEQIYKDIEENGMPYSYSGLAVVELVSIFAAAGIFTISVFSALYVFDVLPLLWSLPIGALIVVVPNLLSFSWNKKLYQASIKIYDRYYTLCSLRKELLEKSLNSEIIKCDNDFSHHSWVEVHMSKEGSDKIDQYYVKLVKDEETGYESFKVKRY